MTDRGQIIPRTISGTTGPVVLVCAAALVMAAPAFSQSSGTLDIPEQIGQPQSGSVFIEEIAPLGRQDVYIEEIAPPNAGAMSGVAIDPIVNAGDEKPVTIMQTQGGRDLCDRSVSDWERQQAGVDCKALDVKSKPHVSPITELATDPLLTPDEGDAKDTFDSLGLGAGVPATVILQK